VSPTVRKLLPLAGAGMAYGWVMAGAAVALVPALVLARTQRAAAAARAARHGRARCTHTLKVSIPAKVV
jgi:hypothetical protein